MILSVLAGCRDEAPPPRAELGELCGEHGPVRLLDLDFDQVLPAFSQPLRVGDHVFTVVARPAPEASGSPYPSTIAPEAWVTGLCGELPTRVGDGVSTVFQVERWPDVALGCRPETGEIVRLDPEGGPPHVVVSGLAPEVGCGLRWTRHGLLSVEPVDADFGALVLHRYPDDPRSETATRFVLHDDVRLRVPGATVSQPGRDVLAGFDEFALALTAEDELVRVELEDGATTTEQTDVFALATSPDGRYLLWQSTTRTNDDPARVEGPVSLRDRETGEDRPLVDTALAGNFFAFTAIDQGLFTLQIGPFGPGHHRVYRLSDLEAVDLGPGHRLRRALDDGRWLVQEVVFPSSRYALFDPARGTSSPLFSGEFDVDAIHPDRVDVLTVSQCCVKGKPTDEGALWSVPLDGEPRRLAPRASRYNLRTPDGSVVTALDLDASLRGTLVVVDPDTEEERVIDEEVLGPSLHTSAAFDPDVVVYAVVGSERSGVYLTRLPAAP